ncbi:MAG: hypothetical protein M1503_00185 [Thaumarchaeota archaeon]|nr:hypothetical protein [Nitrososphaerota archaeon]MCL5316669.1 hypothetical protein [Nitrososphaerota archaeon]
MSMYKTGFKDALELLQKRIRQRQVSNIEDVFTEIESMNARIKDLRYHDLQLVEMPQPVLRALFGVVSK